MPAAALYRGQFIADDSDGVDELAKARTLLLTRGMDDLNIEPVELAGQLAPGVLGDRPPDAVAMVGDADDAAGLVSERFCQLLGFLQHRGVVVESEPTLRHSGKRLGLGPIAVFPSPVIPDQLISGA